MKILIADDDLVRSSRLKEYLCDKSFIHAEDVFIAECYNDAKRLLKSLYFDVMILDVVLPRRKGESGEAQISLQLIDQLERTNTLKKPEKIIGITAHSDDIGSFKLEFERHCLLVIEALPGESEWREKIRIGLSLTGSSKISRVLDEGHTSVISIHGILTHGHWQNRLQRIIEEHTDKVNFSTYKYGWFPLLFFSIPLLRKKQVDKLCRRFKSSFTAEKARHLYVFCHSFGTLLVANTARELIKSSDIKYSVTIVLAGSVLPCDFEWDFLPDDGSINVINDCGSQDNVLLLSESLILGTGMAGRDGFYGFSGGKLVNRFFKGGHSHYFEGDEFMKKYWVPLLASRGRANDVDLRDGQSIAGGMLVSFARQLGSIKVYFYLGAISALVGIMCFSL